MQDIVPAIITTQKENREYRTYVISNLAIGFVFACLGMCAKKSVGIMGSKAFDPNIIK